MASKSGSSVFVGNIAFSITEEQLKEIFETVGPVLKFRLITDKDTGRSKGFGFLDFADPDAAESAISKPFLGIQHESDELTPYRKSRRSRSGRPQATCRMAQWW